MIRSLTALLAVCGACDADPDPLYIIDAAPAGASACSLDPLLELHLAGLDLFDCGRVATADDPSVLRAAHQCALDHATQPFKLRFDPQGIDSEVAEAFVRIGDVSYWYFADLMGPGANTSRRWVCDELVPTEPCSDFELGRTLCLQCSAATEDHRCRD